MQQLFAFLFRLRVLLVFLFFQVICFWLIVNTNTHQRIVFFTSANKFIGSIYESQNTIQGYFDLDNQNLKLNTENAKLKSLLYRKVNSANRLNFGNQKFLQRLNYISGRVINNSIFRSRNSLTLNVGKNDGIKSGMGVITDKGIVGRVDVCSDHFSTVISILNPTVLVSCKHDMSNYLGTINWNTVDPTIVNLKYIPRHVIISIGDTIFTSGFNAVYPEGIAIGVVQSSEIIKDEAFHDVKVKLIQDMGKVEYVYLVDNILKEEQKVLESDEL